MMAENSKRWESRVGLRDVIAAWLVWAVMLIGLALCSSTDALPQGPRQIGVLDRIHAALVGHRGSVSGSPVRTTTSDAAE